MNATLIGLALALAPGLPEAPRTDGPAPVSTDPIIAAPVAAPVTVIRANLVIVGDGTTLENGVVIIEGSRIREVGVGLRVPEGASLIEHDGVLTAGMVAPHSTLVTFSERHDPTRPFLEGAELMHGFDPNAPEYADAAAAGVTTAVLSPSAQNVVGGVTAVVKTQGGRVLEARSHLAISMNSLATSSSRYPTSYSGVMGELNARFGPGAEGVYGIARAGRMPVLIAADTRAEAQRAIDFATRHGLRGAILGARRVGEDQIEALRASGLAVVFGNVSAGLSDRSIQAMLDIVDAGLPFSFGLTNSDWARFGAAGLVRAGADADVVWNGLTAGAAEIAGVDKRVGSLRRGMDADILLWSGHPLDLTSELTAVYIDGQLINGGDDR